MGRINWKVRLKNRIWVLAFLSQILVVGQLVFQGLGAIGITQFQLTQQIQAEILGLVNSIFIVLSILGLIQDPTTRGYADSQRAKAYRKPH
ncbi:phage holin [Mesobacillus maritimus]|uniref:phage holin n=1 Tax=Mesobacillus maritimus TaxID=1643336 RepID=UPI00204157EA|nr:phage holin [Mesobacillus maritimus]MCM3585996.1 phage holin [Mesobacillus maritimus]MCM3670343.1 phage holin [Mesobacillus maritimus]